MYDEMYSNPGSQLLYFVFLLVRRKGGRGVVMLVNYGKYRYFGGKKKRKVGGWRGGGWGGGGGEGGGDHTDVCVGFLLDVCELFSVNRGMLIVSARL